MKKSWLLLLISCLFVLAACSNKQTEEKAAAETTSETKTAVAGTMVVADILDKLEIDSVVGVPTSTVKMPERYTKATEIGNAMNPDMEVVKSLNPDVFISVTTLEYDLKPAVKNINVNGEFIDLQGVKQMQDSILALGKEFNREAQAEKLAKSFDKKLEELKTKTADKKKPKVLAVLGVPGSYLVATDNSYIGSLIEGAGGENAIQGPSEEYLASNTEYLQQSKPDIILRMAHGMPDEVMKMFDKEFKTNTVWKHFDAVKNGRVYDLEEPLFQTTANLQVDDALEELYRIFYEEQ
ncbi:heme ABC transporter substrate-binding protein [Kurthia sp. 3B1D]|uniref:High-affinity heme uptake system protein IsdE n=1 Tax=Candidatus Kurthia intestinigallinarum TaxID=1562256 RepID=A0A433RX73_9BACL|nr:heme ABC transporter substrate-binding protein IsdE [Kurthia sp. 3B1D]RUS57878.1 heme ABC transporter substrate-binding protein [Kurthia sp. 3B1D]